MFGLEISVMAMMIAVNSVFAAYEIALASVSSARLRSLADEKKWGAQVAFFMKGNMEASLAVVQLGITLVGVIAAAVGGAGAEENLTPQLVAFLGVSEDTAELIALALVVLPLTLVTIVVGELIPKVFALRNAEWVCLTLSPFMRWFSFSVWPAVWLFESIVTGVMSWGERNIGSPTSAKSETTELQELRAGAAVARAMRLIGHREERIIQGATEIPSRPVRAIMVAAEHMGTLDANAPLPDNLIAAHLDMHTRFPVVERSGDMQSVIGYVNFKDLITAMRMNPKEASIRSIVRPIPSVRDDKPISDSLEQLMREHTHIALVRDGSDRVLGLVTLEDILEELVGDIEDEFDRLPVHLTASGPGWVAGGGIPLTRLAELTGIDLSRGHPEEAGKNLNAWIEGRLKREAVGGDMVETDTVRVAVRKIRRKKVQEAEVGWRPGVAVENRKADAIPPQGNAEPG